MIGRHPIIDPRTAISILLGSTYSGLSKAGNRRMPPGFCERAGPQTERLATNPIASLSAPRFAVILLIPCGPWQPAPVGGTIFGMQRLFVEPDVFHAIAVVNAVDHGHEPRGLLHTSPVFADTGRSANPLPARARSAKLASPSQAPSNRSRGQ